MSAPDGEEAMANGDSRAPFSRDQLLLLFGITLVGAMLRLFRLSEWSLWVDEAHTYRDAVVPLDVFWSSNVGNYPLSYLLLRGLRDIGLLSGDSEGWLRLPFAFFGILSIPALGLLGRSMVGRRAALIAAALLAISPWHIYWSQNARAYSMVLFVGLLASAAAWHAIDRSARWAVVTAVLTVVAGLCHPSAYILIGAFLAGAVVSVRVSRSFRWNRWFPVLLLALLGFLALVVPPLIAQHARAKPDFSLQHLLATVVFFVRPTLLMAALGGALWLFDRGEPVGKTLVAWAFVPLVVLAILAATQAKVTAQYAFYTLPAFCLLAAALVEALARLVRTAGFRGLLLKAAPLGMLLLDMAGQSYLYFQKYYGERPQWRQAATWIASRSTGPYRVLTTNGPSMQFYLDRREMIDGHGSAAAEVVQVTDFALQKAGGGDRWLLEAIEQATAARVELFVALTEPELYEMDSRKLFDSQVRRRFRQVLRLPNWTGPKDMTVLVYRLQP